MDQSNRSVSDLFDVLRSLIPSRPDPANVQRDFWMPDDSCTVCYECDSKFTLFNRRHHCRLCGRIFCAKCTTNSIPAPPPPPNHFKHVKEERDKIRVCNFCFKQWEQSIVIPNSQSVASEAGCDPSVSPSGDSKTAESITITHGSTLFPLDPSEQMSQSCPLSPYQSAVMDPYQSVVMEPAVTDPHQSAVMDQYIDGQVEEGSGSSSDSGAENRLEYEDDGYLDQEELEGFQDPCVSSHSLQPDGEKSDRNKCMLHESYESHDSFYGQDVKKEIDHDMGYEYEEASSSLCAAEDVEMEPVDFENNGLLWLPPESENEEDEKDAILSDDDDDTGCLGSFGSDDYRGRDKFTEDHRKAMKKIVDEHFRALVSQLLQVENIPVGDDDETENWLEIITSLCWEAATILKPDTSRGGGMDPGAYVKVKCIASGRRSGSTVVKGVVCKKNVAHRRMTTRIVKPCLMILGGALEYQRVSNLLSSVDTLLKQEMDHLKMAVAKIGAHQPNVLLVEKSVSRFAQDCILEKDISLVLNVKRPLLERIARCTGAQILPSVDRLSSQSIGYCDSFHVERLVEEHGSAGQGGKKLSKTLMYFEGCPRPLGCTILLRGANGDELKKVKAVIQYGFFAAYHLALETSFLVDEGAFLPELPLKDPIAVALPNKSLTVDRAISMVSGFTSPATANGMPRLFNGAPAPATDFLSSENTDSRPMSVSSKPLGENPFSVGQQQKNKSSTSTGKADSGVINAHGVGEAVTAMPSLLQQDAKVCQDEPGSSKEEFPPSPSDNQSILVSLSSRCVLKGTVCERSHLFRIKYYGSFDKPLGRVLQDHLFDQNYRCRSCEMPSDAHVQCYTHRQGTLTISVKKIPEIILPGEHEGKIWMWHRCLRCPRTAGIPPATRRVAMSDAAWGLSFGKFLELSFSNHAAASRVASCGHSLHRDCLRFYGSGQMVACFRYASIDVHSVFLPPSIVDFNYEIQDWIKREADDVADRAQVLFSVVLNALSQIAENRSGGESASIKSSSRLHIAELKEVLQNEKAEFEEILQQTLKREVRKGEPAVDILEINRLRRQLLFQSYMWDHRLVYASILDKESFSGDAGSEPSLPNQPKIVDQMREAVAEAKHASGNNFDCCDKLDSGIAFPTPHSPLSCVTNLSDAAAWTSKNQPVDSSLVAAAERLALEGQGEDLGAAANVDHAISWLRMPFVNFYRTLNKNLLGFNHKLDTLGVYNPMICVSSFQELEQQSGARLSLPVGNNEIVIPVFDDEPTSLISYALASQDYHAQLNDEGCRLKETLESTASLPLRDLVMFHSFHSAGNSPFKSFASLDETFLSMSGSQSPLVPDPQLYSKSLHVRVSFSDNGPIDQVKYTVTCYYAKQFDALRKICCPSELDFIRSLSRCKKWGAQGGKSNVFFAKTLDDRFIIKQVTKIELESFIKFAPEYFKYLTEAISTKSPTCLAKILGIYQVRSKNFKGGKETKMDVLVMENLLFGRKVTRLYDLKGSTRSRYNADASGSNKVLLDQNLIEAMPTSPIFVGNKAKRLLERAVWNDTAFLALVDVMDYSLLVGIDEEKHELVLGIIDCMRQYTWDKHLETWVKASGILGGPKNSSPTVISPMQYKKRFRKAMTTYFLMVPDQWSPLVITPSISQSQSQSQGEDDSEGGHGWEQEQLTS